MSEEDGAASRAVVFGHEESLLSSRKWLLGSIGCRCVAVTGIAQCKEAMLDGPLSLVILCQTLSVDECSTAAQFIAENRPTTPLLIMFSRHAHCTPEQDYVLLDATAGPEAFIKTARRMLARAEELAGSPTV